MKTRYLWKQVYCVTVIVHCSKELDTHITSLTYHEYLPLLYQADDQKLFCVFFFLIFFSFSQEYNTLDFDIMKSGVIVIKGQRYIVNNKNSVTICSVILKITYHLFKTLADVLIPLGKSF